MVIVKFAFFGNEFLYVDGGEIADSNFVRRCIFDDFGAEVGTFDGSKVLLVTFPVAGIFVKHVGSASGDLYINNFLPKDSCTDCCSASAFLLVQLVEFVKFLTP